jgi:putative acetyltransferase
MPILVRPDDLTDPAVQQLVAEHLQGMQQFSPPGHVHALAVANLRAPGITFLTAWLDGQLCGCGALKALGLDAGEIKSMRTKTAFLRRGVGQAVLDTIERTACTRGYRHLYLETGTGPAFDAAHQLYLRSGFAFCGPFGDYRATEFNVFMSKVLADPTTTPRIPPTNLL